MNNKLNELLNKKLTHISEVHKLFDYCEDEKEIEEVINEIPLKFGNFTYEILAGGESFRITNAYEENGDMQYEDVDHDFWVEYEPTAEDTKEALEILNEAYMIGRETGHPLWHEDWKGISEDLEGLHYDKVVIKARFDELCNM